MKDNILVQLAVSFGLGLLLGLQRERTERSIAGFRTLSGVGEEKAVLNPARRREAAVAATGTPRAASRHRSNIPLAGRDRTMHSAG